MQGNQTSLCGQSLTTFVFWYLIIFTDKGRMGRMARFARTWVDILAFILLCCFSILASLEVLVLLLRFYSQVHCMLGCHSRYTSHHDTHTSCDTWAVSYGIDVFHGSNHWWTALYVGLFEKDSSPFSHLFLFPKGDVKLRQESMVIVASTGPVLNIQIFFEVSSSLYWEDWFKSCLEMNTRRYHHSKTRALNTIQCLHHGTNIGWMFLFDVCILYIILLH